MNISSEILGFNSSDHFFSNGTDVKIHFNTDAFVFFLFSVWVVSINAYMVWLIAKGRGNGLSAEFFSLNLSVCEMIYCVESFLNFLAILFDSTTTLQAVYFLDGIVITCRPLFQCVICVERYLAVLHPVTFLKFKPLRYRLICSVLVWMASFVTCVISGITFIFYVSVGYLVFLCVQFFLLLVPQLFCCVSVLRALKQSGPGDREKEEENHMKRRAFYLILISTVSMIIIYAPYIISLFLNILIAKMIDILLSIGYVSFALAGVIQPFLFLYRVGKLPFIKY